VAEETIRDVDASGHWPAAGRADLFAGALTAVVVAARGWAGGDRGGADRRGCGPCAPARAGRLALPGEGPAIKRTFPPEPAARCECFGPDRRQGPRVAAQWVIGGTSTRTIRTPPGSSTQSRSIPRALLLAPAGCRHRPQPAGRPRRHPNARQRRLSGRASSDRTSIPACHSLALGKSRSPCISAVLCALDKSGAITYRDGCGLAV
jgi:hypothetical protein